LSENSDLKYVPFSDLFTLLETSAKSNRPPSIDPNQEKKNLDLSKIRLKKQKKRMYYNDYDSDDADIDPIVHGIQRVKLTDDSQSNPGENSEN
jgi:hypothetical protein